MESDLVIFLSALPPDSGFAMSAPPLSELSAQQPPLPSSGRINVRVGIGMVVAALICLGILVEQGTPPPEGLSQVNGEIDWSQVPVEYYAWRLCYAHLGNMGILNLAGGAVLLFLGPKLLGHRWLSRILLVGGLMHPGAWALVALTGGLAWRWLGRLGALGVLVVLLILVGQLSLAQILKRRRDLS